MTQPVSYHIKDWMTHVILLMRSLLIKAAD